MPRTNPNKARTIGEFLNPFDQQSKYSRMFKKGQSQLKKARRKKDKGKHISSNCKYVNGKWVCNQW